MQERSREERHNLRGAGDTSSRALAEFIHLQSNRLLAAAPPLKALAVLLLSCNPMSGYQAGPANAGVVYRSVAASPSPCTSGTQHVVLMRQNTSLEEEILPAAPLDSSTDIVMEDAQMQTEEEEEENELDLDEVAKILKSDIPQILRQEPNWDIYASEFHFETSLEGAAVLKLLSNFLERRDKTCVLEEDIQVNFVDGREMDEPFNPFFLARWKVVLDRPFNPLEKVIRYLSFWLQNDPITVQAETIFKLNHKNQVDSVQIDKLIVDGWKIPAWSPRKVSQHPADVLNRVKSIMKEAELDPLQTIKEKFNEWARDVKALDLTASPIIRTWTSLAAKSKATAETEIECDDTKAKVVKKLSGAQKILSQMADDIEWSSPDEILALVHNADSIAADLSMNIFAMATASQEFIFDSSGKLEAIAENLGLKQAGFDLYVDGRVPVVEIGEVVAMPSQCAGSMRGLGEELLMRIVRRGAALGRLVVIAPANDPLEKYYGKIGFERIDDFGRSMVYSKPLPEATDNEFLYEMASLQVA